MIPLSNSLPKIASFFFRQPSVSQTVLEENLGVFWFHSSYYQLDPCTRPTLGSFSSLLSTPPSFECSAWSGIDRWRLQKDRELYYHLLEIDFEEAIASAMLFPTFTASPHLLSSLFCLLWFLFGWTLENLLDPLSSLFKFTKRTN